MRHARTMAMLSSSGGSAHHDMDSQTRTFRLFPLRTRTYTCTHTPPPIRRSLAGPAGHRWDRGGAAAPLLRIVGLLLSAYRRTAARPAAQCHLHRLEPGRHLCARVGQDDGRASPPGDHHRHALQCVGRSNQRDGAHRQHVEPKTVPAIRARMLSSLVNVSANNPAATVAAGLGMVAPMATPRAATRPAAPEVHASPALSLTHLPG